MAANASGFSDEFDLNENLLNLTEDQLKDFLGVLTLAFLMIEIQN